MIDREKIKKAAQLSADREFRVPEAGDEDRRYTGPEIAWLDFVNLVTPSAVLELFAELDQLKAELECAVGDIRTATQIIERNQKGAECFRYLAERKEWPDAISDLVDCGSPAAIRAAILLEIDQ